MLFYFSRGLLVRASDLAVFANHLTIGSNESQWHISTALYIVCWTYAWCSWCTVYWTNLEDGQHRSKSLLHSDIFFQNVPVYTDLRAGFSLRTTSVQHLWRSRSRGVGGGARARPPRVLDGGSLRGGVCSGRHCCDWSPTCRQQGTQCLFRWQTLPAPQQLISRRI